MRAHNRSNRLNGGRRRGRNEEGSEGKDNELRSEE